MKNKLPVNKQQKSDAADIQAFLSKAASLPARKQSGVPGRLLFAIDATASRQPTWDTACQLQGEMFNATSQLGGLNAQLCYYRGFGQFHTSAWVSSTQQLMNAMTSVQCLGGHTQIHRVLSHLLAETRQQRVNAAVFIGDAMEEKADDLCDLAGQLGLLGVPLFIFHEGHDVVAGEIFKQMSQLSGGAYCPFNEQSAHMLADLLAAVAVFASGGRLALESFSRTKNSQVKHLLTQLK